MAAYPLSISYFTFTGNRQRFIMIKLRDGYIPLSIDNIVLFLFHCHFNFRGISFFSYCFYFCMNEGWWRQGIWYVYNYTYTGRVEIAAACDMLTYGTMLSPRFYAFFTFFFFFFFGFLLSWHNNNPLRVVYTCGMYTNIIQHSNSATGCWLHLNRYLTCFEVNLFFNMTP